MVDNLRAETCFKFRLQAFSKNDTAKKKLAQEEIYADTLGKLDYYRNRNLIIQSGPCYSKGEELESSTDLEMIMLIL